MSKINCILESEHGFYRVIKDMDSWTKNEYKAKIFSDEEELGEYENHFSEIGVKVSRVPVVICLARTPETPEEPKRHLEVVKD